MHDFCAATIKAPNEVEGPWDYYNILRTIPAEDAAQPLSQSRCPLITQSN
jgi:branched-chain amino acid transport system substrate-binding protein